jgi:hypothetical protein
LPIKDIVFKKIRYRPDVARNKIDVERLPDMSRQRSLPEPGISLMLQSTGAPHAAVGE